MITLQSLISPSLPVFVMDNTGYRREFAAASTIDLN
jgi:hypothetical protein